MENTGYIALSRQAALRQQMDLVANNMANLNTPGYKGEDMLFVEYLDETVAQQPLSYVQNIGLVRNLEPGPMVPTENPLDLAIQGEGYFSIQTPEGPRYTRNGTFSLNAEGQVVNAAGLALLDNAGAPIAVPEGSGDITIARDGTISGDAGQIAQIGLVNFENEQALEKIGDGLLDAGDQLPAPVAEGEIVQGMIESSNVKGVIEMTRMIEVLRSYQSASRLINEEHRRLREAISRLTSAGQG